MCINAFNCEDLKKHHAEDTIVKNTLINNFPFYIEQNRLVSQSGGKEVTSYITSKKRENALVSLPAYLTHRL